jgi:LDH2 family malate/lactate/ureidoglycolate dehydrogenase
MTGRTTVDLAKFRALCEALVAEAGFTAEESRQIADVLLYAELRGNNQGVTKIAEGSIARVDGEEPVTTLVEKGAILHLDAGMQQGMVVVADAADRAVAIAKQHGVACVALRRISGSTAAIGYYVRRMADAGVVGMLLGGTPKVVAPAGGVDPVLGTNPIAIGFPRADGPPVVLDLATSAIAWYGLITARDRGEAIPGDVAIDAGGNPTTDPAAAMAGAIRALAGHKGGGLALMMELITGALVGGCLPGEPDGNNNRGTLIVAIDPAALGTDDMAAAAAATIATIKASRAEAGKEILLPGERGDRLMQRQLDAGTIDIDDHLLTALNVKAREAGIEALP